MKSVFCTVFAALAMLLAVSSSWPAGQPQLPVRVLVPQTTSALPFLLMEKEQSIPGARLRVEFFANHAQALALLLRGDADFLLSGTSQGWENRLDGSPLVMIDTGVWGISSLVGKDPSIKGFADLRGKRVGLPFPGSPLDFQTRALLAFDTIDADKDLTISFGPFAQSVQRLMAGQLDAVALPEPLATAMVKQNRLLRLVDFSQAWARLTGGDRMSPQVSLFATQGHVESRGTLVSSVIAAWDAATRAVNAAPADAAARFAEELSVDPGILEESTRATLLAVPSAAENKTRVLAYYQAVARYLSAGARPLDERFFFMP